MSVQVSLVTEPVSEDQILSAIRASLGARAEVLNCTQMHGGHFNTLYDIETSSPAERVILRIAPRDDWPLYSFERTMMLGEPFVYDLIKRAGVPTTEVLAVDGSRSIIDRDYMIVRYIDALPLNDPSVPRDVRPLIMRELGAYTARIHGISGALFGRILPDGTIGGSESWAEVFGELLVEMLTKGCEAEIICRADSDSVIEYYWDHRAIFDECDQPVLVHNDIWDPNILIKQNGDGWAIEAIIDADRALFADREFESVLWDNPDNDLLAGYGMALGTSAMQRSEQTFIECSSICSMRGSIS
jgi:aminoglycoside phosphotransferase (APT) family kinase protein